jgi:hemerythrin-like domain-containing protein
VIEMHTREPYAAPTKPSLVTGTAEILKAIRREHATMESLLGILEQELGIFRTGERPNFEILSGVMEYFRDFPVSYHEPKETLVLEALRASHPALASELTAGARQASCDRARARVDEMADLLEQVIDDQEVERNTVVSTAYQIAAQERRHIEFTENRLLTAAEQNLSSRDWDALDRKIMGSRDPVVDPERAAIFDDLADRLERWEREDQAERAWFSQGR